jgi:hypothetical protein
MRHRHQSMLTALTSVGFALAVLGIGPRPVDAQQYKEPTGAPEPATVLSGTPAAAPMPTTLASGLQVTVTPYLWLAGVNAAVSTPLERAPVVNESVGPFELLGKLNGVPFMGSAEVRDGPFSLLGDVLHLPVGTNITTRNVFFQGGSATLTANIGTAVFLYHAVERPVQTIDGGVGFRSWGLSTGLTLNGGLLPTTSLNRAGGWADPLIAARYHRDFGNGFGLTAYGDVGGFGIAAHADWQIVGTLDYALKPWLNLQLGYRSLNVSYSANERPLGFNAHMKGPMLAATFRF